MPIQVTQQDTRLSFAYAINSVQNAMTINRDAEGNRTDGFLKAAGKVVTRTVANTALSVAALVETIVKALFVVVTAGQYGPAKAQLSLAARTFVEAAKGIVQKSTPTVAQEPVKVEESVKTQEPVKVEESVKTQEPVKAEKSVEVEELDTLEDIVKTEIESAIESATNYVKSFLPNLRVM